MGRASDRSMKPLLPSLALATASILLSLGALEVGLRAASFDPLRELREGRELVVRASEDPEIGYELVPGARGHAWGTDVDVNAAGFRGREPSEDHERRRRIVVLGDSITFGNDLPVDATYPHLLEGLLVGRDARWEVLNFGVGGYDTLQEVALFERRGVSFRPELVIVGYSLNDAGVVSVNRRYVERQRHYGENPFVLHSRLLQFVLSRWERRFIADYVDQQRRAVVFRETFEGRIDPIGEEEEELLGLMARVPDRFPSSWYGDPARVGRIRFAFRRLASLARQHGFAVAVLIVPRLESGLSGYPHEVAHAIVDHEARRQGFAVVDPTAAFLGAGMSTLRIDPNEWGHPNEAGHRILARALERWIAAQFEPGGNTAASPSGESS
jgi:lysophospholipase L1-like esterase